jgi:hypothetical protein
MHKKKKLQKKRKFVGLSVCSVWSVVFVGTTEYTEYTEREGVAAGVFCIFVANYLGSVSICGFFLGALAVQSYPCPSVSIRGSPPRWFLLFSTFPVPFLG